MAYGSLIVVSKLIDQILPNHQAYSFICSKEQVTTLHGKVFRFLEFFEQISGRPCSSEVDELESRIRDAAYKLEDMFESLLIRSFEDEVQDDDDENEVEVEDDDGRQEVDVQLTSTLSAVQFASCIEQVDLLLGEAMEMKKVLDEKVISRNYIHSHSIATPRSPCETPGATGTKVGFVGLDDALAKILGMVTRGRHMLETIPITGMGGIGKTTLARAVYDRPGIKHHFDLVLWVTVSQDYDTQDILRQLNPDSAESDAIVSVHKRLTGRSYLIVLDDVWDTKAWDGVRNAFPDDNKGSRVIITTRLSNIATYVCSSNSHTHQMQLLNEEQSWDLLRETVYGHESCPGEFQDIGRTISRSSKGLPLALIVIGGLLKFNKAINYWKEVAARTTTEAAGNDESLLDNLSLSYKNLPPHLKACFLYFGIFPEDEEISTKQLVRLWAAEGFLKPRESKTMEDVAEECLEELVDRNLVLIKEKRYNGKIKTSRLHDVLRALSLRQAQKEKFLHYYGTGELDKATFLRIIRDQRRVSCLPNYIISFNSLVRTFRTKFYIKCDELSTIAHSYKLLRVLEKVEAWSVWKGSSLGILFSMTNLRYFHLVKRNGDGLVMVPESISKLRNLETIKVSGSSCESPFLLPVQIWEMQRLRHLVSEVGFLLSPFPTSGLDDYSIESSSLQTLCGVLNLDFTPCVVQKLQNLKKLKVYYKENSMDGARKVYVLDNLVSLNNLEDLSITCEYQGPRVAKMSFPCNLKKLRLIRTQFRWKNMVMVGTLPHLEALKLEWDAFGGKLWEPVEGGFLQLKYLKMELLNLKEWRVESTHFPCLEKLVIDSCWHLKEVPASIGDIDTLQTLIVRDTNNDVEESVRSIQDEQESNCNDSLQVYILSPFQDLPK